MDLPSPDLTNPIHLLAFGLGAGLAPWAPGTVGSLVALLPWWWAARLGRWGYLLVILGVAVLGVAICGITARDLAFPDHPGIVWDEMGGLLVTLIGLPRTLRAGLAGFLAFRLFDILKPWPVGWVDQTVHGGLGIVLDDLLAGLYALALLHIGWWLLRKRARAQPR